MSLPFAPAAERNCGPILAALRQHLTTTDHVLEIGSGTGQHVVTFARELPHIHWQPSDLDPGASGLSERVSLAACGNIATPITLNVADEQWPADIYDACLSINTLHIMSFENVAALFERVGHRLADQGQMLIYGPMRIDGEHTGEGNRSFDAALRASDPNKGIRDTVDLNRLAANAGLRPKQLLTMPADNRLCIWQRS